MNSETPLTGGDRVKIGLFFLALASTLIFGVIPILIALLSIYIMKKDKSFSPIIKSKKYIKGYLILLALLVTVSFSIGYSYVNGYSWIVYLEIGEWGDKGSIAKLYKDTAMVAFALLVLTAVAVSLLMSLFSMLYFRPLEEHQGWIVSNGIFSDLKESEDDDSTEIIGRDKLSSFSVADELIKWNDLLEKNLISQEEFNRAKQKLLNQKS